MNDLGKDTVGRLLLNLAIPAIVAQVVNVLYNIVDRMFIGRIPNGELAIAGIGIVFPIIIIITAFSALYGIGGAPRCAIKMGQRDMKGAEQILTNSFTMLVGSGIILTFLFYFFRESLLWMFGATEATIDYALDYISIYLFGTIFVQIALGMNPYINTQGFAKISMFTVMIGAVVNILLDWIFIFGFDLGVKGAAYATVIAQGVSALWVVCFLRGKQTKLKLRLAFWKPSRHIVGNIITLGISPFVMQSTESIVLIALNMQLMRYGGDLAVGSMTIMTGIMQMIIMPLQGLAQGLQPIVSYNYGARRLDRVRQAIKLTFQYGMTFTLLICGILIIYPEPFVRIFNDQSQLVLQTADYIRIYFLGIFIFGAQIICQQIFLALGKAQISIFLAFLRKIILLVPLIFILPNWFVNKVNGVLWAEPLSDILAALTTLICFYFFYRRNLRTYNE